MLLLAGSGSFSFDWYFVQRAAMSSTRVCSYDRAGLAWSDPGPLPHTFAQAVFDLRALIDRSGERGPFLLVGHSLGGLIARLFAARYPHDVAGVVLLDTGAETTLQFINGRFAREIEAALPEPIPAPRLATVDSERTVSAEAMRGIARFRQAVGPPAIDGPYTELPPALQELRLWAMGQPFAVLADDNPYAANEEVLSLADRIRNPQQLGDIPLIVIGRSPDTVSAVADPASGAVRRVHERPAELRALGQLSSNSVVIRATHSRHEVHLDRPDLVLQAIANLREAIRTHSHVVAPTTGATILQ
ncbi:MAG TPA: alpha/beta hydrolase [Gemmatimonadales bacterium]|nr:alpha/beta hydrolase [Gemmatimonadales bacterium]